MGYPHDQLRRVRQLLGISLRNVEDLSQQLADEHGNPEFFVSKAWLTRLEAGHPTSNIHKLLSLSSIYHIPVNKLLKLYGADLDRFAGHQLATELPNTHLASLEIYDRESAVSFPVCFDPTCSLNETNLLSRIVEVWGKVPLALLQHLDLRHSLYGFIGLEDMMMYPLLRPGSFVQIDDREKRVEATGWHSEYERPIYFVELRDSYVCCWCELHDGRLTLVPHPLSPKHSRQVSYPDQALIIGRVTAAAMRLVNEKGHARTAR
ncbi:MAG: hypothetical protein LC803_21905 [Acidobacteria bacterium]|nr:hypothetical protein [Acidobacteriota bacterium]